MRFALARSSVRYLSSIFGPRTWRSCKVSSDAALHNCHLLVQSSTSTYPSKADGNERISEQHTLTHAKPAYPHDNPEWSLYMEHKPAPRLPKSRAPRAPRIFGRHCRSWLPIYVTVLTSSNERSSSSVTATTSSRVFVEKSPAPLPPRHPPVARRRPAASTVTPRRRGGNQVAVATALCSYSSQSAVCGVELGANLVHAAQSGLPPLTFCRRASAGVAAAALSRSLHSAIECRQLMARRDPCRSDGSNPS